MTETAHAQLLETWAIHNRIHLYLLDAIPTEALTDVSASKGRTVGAQLAHLHNVRLMWLDSAAKDLLAGLAKVEKAQDRDHGLLRQSLIDSGEAVAAMVGRALESDGRVKGFKPHATAFLGYLISHESHHRGEIQMTLTQAGHKITDKISYGMWEWGVR